MDAPDDRRYSDSHEWFKVEGDEVIVGITSFAVDQLTDITFVEMRAAGTEVGAGDALGEVESVKTTSDIYTSVGGTISAVNEALSENPGLVNEDPYGAGWLVKLKAGDVSAFEGLKDAAAYASENG
ncbi:MAG: glycine cleavage system protein GcvH [Planctomycetota bacterium]